MMYLLVCLIPHSSHFVLVPALVLETLKRLYEIYVSADQQDFDVSPFLSCEILVTSICSVAK